MLRRTWLALGLLLLLLAVIGGWLYRRTTRYDHNIAQAAARNELDFYLIKAIIYEESWFRPDIRGSVGELGLMQITMAAAQDFVSQKGFPPLYEARLLEPELNIEIGAWYVKQSLERYRDSPAPLVFALARYNAGEVRADNWLQRAKSKPAPPGMSQEEYSLSVVDFPTTREYVRQILRRSETRNFWF